MSSLGLRFRLFQPTKFLRFPLHSQHQYLNPTVYLKAPHYSNYSSKPNKLNLHRINKAQPIQSRRKSSWILGGLAILGGLVLAPVLLPLSITAISLGIGAFFGVFSLVLVGTSLLGLLSVGLLMASITALPIWTLYNDAKTAVKNDRIPDNWIIREKPTGPGFLSLISSKPTQFQSFKFHINFQQDLWEDRGNSWIRIYAKVAAIARRDNALRNGEFLGDPIPLPLDNELFNGKNCIWLERDFLGIFRFHIPVPCGNE
jgi:hypothetical protein